MKHYLDMSEIEQLNHWRSKKAALKPKPGETSEQYEYRADHTWEVCAFHERDAGFRREEKFQVATVIALVMAFGTGVVVLIRSWFI